MNFKLLLISLFIAGICTLVSILVVLKYPNPLIESEKNLMIVELEKKRVKDIETNIKTNILIRKILAGSVGAFAILFLFLFFISFFK